MAVSYKIAAGYWKQLALMALYGDVTVKAEAERRVRGRLLELGTGLAKPVSEEDLDEVSKFPMTIG